MRAHGRSRNILIAVGLIAVAMVSMLAIGAQTAEAKSARYQHFDADLVLEDDGSFQITETQVVAFDGGPFAQGYRSIPTARTGGITGVTVAELIDGKLVPYTKGPVGNLANGIHRYSSETANGAVTIKWSFEPTYDQTRTFVVRYTMLGALRVYPDETPPNQQIWWTAVGSDLTSSTGVDASRVTITLPSAVTLSQVVIDSEGSNLPESHSTDGKVFTWDKTAFGSGDDFTIRMQFPPVLPDATAPAWQANDDATRARQEASNSRNSLIHWMMLGAGLLFLGGGVAGSYGLWYTRGRDPHTGLVADFIPQPPDNLSPGLAGTLVDEQANESDIVATLLDLAHRGEIKMTDLGLSSPDKRATGRDYQLELVAADRKHAPHETRMLTAIFGVNPAPGAATTLSSSRRAVVGSYPEFKDDLYRELVTVGYFSRSPEETRSVWRKRGMWIGGLAIVVAVVGLIAFDSFTLIPAIALLLLGFVIRSLSKAMPQKTTAGAEAAAKWKAFKRYLQEIDRYEKLEESRQIFDKYLAYAVAFGLEKSWVSKFDQVNTPSPGWFDAGDVMVPRGYGHGHTVWTTGGGSSHSGGGSGGMNMPDIDLPGLPDIQKASGKAASGVQSGSSGLMSLLKVAGAIIEIASTFSGGGGSGGSSGGGGGGFN